MFSLFRHFGQFINNMDARAITSLMVSLALMGFIFVMMMYGEQWLGIDQLRLRQMMSQIAESPFALIGVISVYCLLAMTGFPQTFLIAGTVAVFGVQIGIMYAWAATMASATLTFALGNAFGGGFVKSLSAGRAQSLISKIQHHGVLTSMLIRWTPSAPFIVVNAIAGAAHISIIKFWVGTGIGIIPKIVFIAAFTDQVDELVAFFSNRDPRHLIVVGGVLLAWLSFMAIVHRIYARLR